LNIIEQLLETLTGTYATPHCPFGFGEDPPSSPLAFIT